MTSPNFDDAGKLVLRLTIGILMLLHGIGKLTGGIGGIEAMLLARGMPAFFAWGVYVGEILAPLLVILGVYARAGAVLIVVNMLVAIALVHRHEIGMLTDNGGWAIELQGLFLFGAAAIALLGAGRFSVGGRHGPLN